MLCLPDYSMEIPPFLQRVEGPQKWRYPQLHDGTLYPRNTGEDPQFTLHSSPKEIKTPTISGNTTDILPVSLPSDPLDRLAAIAKLPRGSAPQREISENEKRRIASNQARRERARERVSKMKANKSVDKKAMPLVGKDALRRIKEG